MTSLSDLKYKITGLETSNSLEQPRKQSDKSREKIEAGYSSEKRARSEEGSASFEEPVAKRKRHHTDRPEAREDLEETEEHGVRPWKYVTFNGEDETDYTADLPSMIGITGDPAGEQTAILMSFELSKAIQDSVLGTREFDIVERRLKAEEEGLRDREAALESTIAFLERRASRLLEMGTDPPTQGPVKLAVDAYAKVRQELKERRTELQENRTDQTNLERDLDKARQKHRHRHRKADQMLDNVFTECLLLEPADSSVSNQEVSHAEALHRQSKSPSQQPAQIRDPARERLQAQPVRTELNPEEDRVALGAEAAYWRAKQELRRACEALSDRKAEEWDALDQWRRDQAEGVPRETRSEFDQGLLRAIIFRMRAIAAAEDALCEAREHAVSVHGSLNKVDYLDELERYGDRDICPSYAPSQINGMTPRRRSLIEDWRESSHEGLNSGDARHHGEDESDDGIIARSIGLFENGEDLAVGSEKEKIDKWGANAENNWARVLVTLPEALRPGTGKE
ncbi:hypothetical protein M8818_007270 [Zalaria obscura]|uniref:Uncharacterized protein n=1 Tax=Zalaria obscura TaxID=2024903 RepID=A0ACC3S5E4_9PEZI